MKDYSTFIGATYAIIAIVGGAARYLNSYIQGGPFNIYMFLASAFVAAFSGLMFAYTGNALGMPNPWPHLMAGMGGFFGDNAMKLLFEMLKKKM